MLKTISSFNSFIILSNKNVMEMTNKSNKNVFFVFFFVTL